ncbi:MAG: hypothetical protein ACRDBG_22975 [Waterburya sp.]
MNILLRDATPLDFAPIAQISVESYQEYSTVLDAESWQTMKNNLSNVENTAKIANFIVAEIVNEIVGAIAYYPPSRSNSKFIELIFCFVILRAIANASKRYFP